MQVVSRMAYIESHQTLSRHKKLLRLVRYLQADKHKLIGHLHELWWWALDNVPADGNLGDLTDEEIAVAAEWTGDPQEFAQALVQAGFIDLRPDGSRALHDWYDYAGRLYEARQAAAEGGRRGNHERWHVQRGIVDPTCPYCQESGGESGGDRYPIGGAIRGRFGGVSGAIKPDAKSPSDAASEVAASTLLDETKNPTVGAFVAPRSVPRIGANRTKPNQDKPRQTNTPPYPPSSGGDASPPDGGSVSDSAKTDKPRRNPVPLVDEEFERFWSVYPRKIAKQAARRAWNACLKREPPPGELARASPEQLIRAAEEYARRCARERTDSKYIMHASTFLGPSERWRDYLGSAKVPPPRQETVPVGAPNAGAYRPVSAQAVAAFKQLYPDEYG